MRNFTLIFFLLLLYCLPVKAQVFSAGDFTGMASLTKGKLDNFIAKQGFVSNGSDMVKDTVIANYIFVNRNKKELPDSTERFLSHFILKNDFKISYKTTSETEAHKLKSSLFSYRSFRKSVWTMNADSSLFFQKGDITILITKKIENHLENYYFILTKKYLPAARDVQYAEDLLVFNSHENLEYVFGKENVKKDVYYFSENQVNKCSVLYPNTSRQVIFLWEDETNNYKLSSILIGGTLRVKSALNFNEYLGPNVWALKNGIHSGMSLQELQLLNGGSFKFYGFNSSYSGIVVPENKGNIDFKKNGVMLTCLNCNDAAFLKHDIIDASEAIEDNRKLYVFTIFLLPAKDSILSN
jgi:hypothetical protein